MCWNYSLWLGLRSHHWLCLNPFGMKWFCWVLKVSMLFYCVCYTQELKIDAVSVYTYVCILECLFMSMCGRSTRALQNSSRVLNFEHQNFFFNLTLRHVHYPVIQCTLTWFQFGGWCLQVIFSQHGGQIKMNKCNGPASICFSFKQ